MSGQLDDIVFKQDPIFGLHVPTACPDVAMEALDVKGSWADKAAYDRTAKELATSYHKAFAPFRQHVSPEVAAAGPLIA